jgi:uncharacterized membrane protein YqjE
VTTSAAPSPLDALRILHAAGGALLSQAQLHAQLAGVEWQEEKNRLLRMLAAALLGFACLLCALLFAGALALAATWDTSYRVPTIAALAILFSLGLVAAWRYFQAQSALGSQSFAASREELAADTAVLKAVT